MNPRLFSLCTPCPEGFTFCREFQARDFRKAPFALYAPSPDAARLFLGEHLPRLSGVILIPGDRLCSEEVTSHVLKIVVSPAMLPYLADFAAHQLTQINQRLSSEERSSFLTLENERLVLNNQRSSEEFSQFRASLLHEMEERRAAERQLVESEELLRLIMSSTVEAIYGIDTNGICTFANESCLKMLGYDHIGEVLGHYMHDLIHFQTPDGQPMPVEECRIFKAFRDGNGITVGDEVFWRRDGSSFPVEYSSYPIRRDGTVVGAVVTWRDITEQKRVIEERICLEKQLLHARKLALQKVVK
jgi:PAS domain S-box-containing protein